MPIAISPTTWNFNIDRYVNPWLPPVPWKYVPRPVAHFFGHRERHQKSLGNIVIIFWSFIGIFCSLVIIEAVGRQITSFRDHQAPIIIGSFGAAAVLEFYAIESPLAQPRNAVLGQLLSSVVGIAMAKAFGLGRAGAGAGSGGAGLQDPQEHQLAWLAGSLSCACAVSVMGLTGTVHPPAGATALLAVVDADVAGLGWFLLPVVALGCVLMQAVALLINNVQRRFPVYWWSPEETGRRWRHRRPRRQEYGEERGKGEEAEGGGGGGGGETDSNRGARFQRVASHASHASHHALDRGAGEGAVATEAGREPETEPQARVLITRGMVHVPDDLYITQEERMFLEELSERL